MFGWQTDVTTSTTSIRDWNATESATLLWLCTVSSFQWEFYLQPFRGYLYGDYTSSHILFPYLLQLLPSTIKIFGSRALLTVFHSIRCCVFCSMDPSQKVAIHPGDVYKRSFCTPSPFSFGGYNYLNWRRTMNGSFDKACYYLNSCLLFHWHPPIWPDCNQFIMYF